MNSALRPARLEKREQADIKDLLERIGSTVYVLGTCRPRGKPCPACGAFVPESQTTRQTPGIADVFAFLPVRPPRQPVPRLLAVECKREGGRASAEQINFLQLCRGANVAHILGTFNDVESWLKTEGYIR